MKFNLVYMELVELCRRECGIRLVDERKKCMKEFRSIGPLMLHCLVPLGPTVTLVVHICELIPWHFVSMVGTLVE